LLPLLVGRIGLPALQPADTAGTVGIGRHLRSRAKYYD
jgi:hypothetical protein